MATHKNYTWPIATIVVAMIIGIIVLPNDSKKWAPSFLKSPTFHFGLDLAGGTQLDFRISEEEITKQIEDIKKEIAGLEATEDPSNRITILNSQLLSIEDQRRNIVEAIRTVLERRINALGVSEAVITPSYVGNEKHLIVECPGVVDTQECINTVGKTIQLEFKEEFTEATEEYEKEVREKVDAVLARIKGSGESLAIVGENLSADIAVGYEESRVYFKDDLPEEMQNIWNRSASETILKRDATIQVPGQDGAGQRVMIDVEGIFLLEVLKGRESQLRPVYETAKAFATLASRDTTTTYASHDNQSLRDGVTGVISQALQAIEPGGISTAKMEDGSAKVLYLREFTKGSVHTIASHILISYQDAQQTGNETTRTKEEALILTQELRQRLLDGANFETLAREYSDAPSGKEGGSLGVIERGSLGLGLEDVERTAFSLPKDEIGDPVESPFGYHIIRSDKVATLDPDTASYDELTITGENATDRAQAYIAQLQQGLIQVEEDAITLRTLFFSLAPTGWKDTLLDGKHFRAATVTLDPTTGIPIVQISFDDEGGILFQELTKNNINKRIAIFVGGQLISAPTVQGEIIGGTAIITGSQNFEDARLLATDLNTGAIPAPIYLTGQRTVEATLGAQALQTSLKAALIGIVILMLYMIVMYRLLGVLADIALSVYALIFIAFLKLPLFLFSSQYIVLTLAGMAGIILSIGMAVDANVLIFERIKEELRKGKMLRTAAETGFTRAWPSIRDGNVSTFITCTILFLIGTSVIRGFAVTLGIGVLISMFSAIVITRWLIRKIAEMPVAENAAAFGVQTKEAKE